MKTLQIIGDSNFGGGTILLLSWCRHLVSKGCQVDILTTDERTKKELVAIPGVKVIDDIFIPREIEPCKDIKALAKLYSLIRLKNYDVVQTYTATPGFIGRIAAWLAGTKVILHHQAAWAYSEASSPLKRFLYSILEIIPSLLSTFNICVGDSVAQEAKAFKVLPTQKLYTIRNGVDPAPFTKLLSENAKKEFRSKLKIPDNIILIGTTGRLAPLKDNTSLIYAMNLIQTTRPDLQLKLLLCGEGSERQQLENLVVSLGLESSVQFLGFWNDIPQFLAGIDIFVSPTLREGLSISILEAMASAKPIIVTSIPPNLELIEHENSGLIVPTKSPEAIARAIMRFVENPDLARDCAQSARKKVLESYTIDRMFDETFHLYNDMLALKTRPGLGN